MNGLINWHNDVIGKRTVEALKKNNFNATYFSERQKAIEYVLQLIPDDTTVGVGGSKTVTKLGLVELLEKNGHELFNHNKEGLTKEEKIQQRYKQLMCDVFLSSANAITLSGEIMNRDAFGNRAAAMMFGPKKVIIVVGINKIVRNLEEAEEHIKRYAAPLNNKKYETPNPCVTFGECMDCKTAQRLCNITTIINRCPPLTDIHVVVLGENLGF